MTKQRDHYEHMYNLMLLLRRFEEKVQDIYKAGHIAGFCHLYIGQEAIAVGLKEVLTDLDYMITTYRNHAHAIVAGIEPKHVMAELTGRIGGCCKGKGGSMHLFSKKKRFLGGFGIVGTTAPLGTGVAFAQKYKKTGGISVALMGDGAVHQGQVAEAFNLAALWELPILFLIEDNGYAISTSKKSAASGKELYLRGEAFGIPGKYADGQDIDEVIAALKWAAEYVRMESKPAILQFDTYRYKGHSVSDAARLYRTREEEEKIIDNRDCLQILANRIKLSESKIAEMEAAANIIIQEAADFALQSPLPPVEELMSDVYA